MTPRPTMRWVGALITAFVLSVSSASAEDVRESIRAAIEQIDAGEPFVVGADTIAAVDVLPELYIRRSYAPAWTRAENIDALFAAIRNIDQDGLDNADYHLAELERLRRDLESGGADAPYIRASYDLLLTDSLTRLAYHLVFGKVDPSGLFPHWNLERWIDDQDPVATIQAMIDDPGLAKRIESLKPKHLYYNQMRSALEHYRAIEAAGGPSRRARRCGWV